MKVGDIGGACGNDTFDVGGVAEWVPPDPRGPPGGALGGGAPPHTHSLVCESGRNPRTSARGWVRCEGRAMKKGALAPNSSREAI